jgi:hypothetical protein
VVRFVCFVKKGGKECSRGKGKDGLLFSVVEKLVERVLGSGRGVVDIVKL